MTEKQKILIVDDNKDNLVALRQVLGELDAEIIEATTGNQALTATLDHQFAVAILDVMMPGMNGYELAENLRGDRKTQVIPIVFVTATYADELHEFKGYEAGGIDYIVKPFAPAVLLGKVRAFLEIDRYKRELQRHRDHLETLVAQRTVALEERVKEVQCLYAISNLVAMPCACIGKSLQAAVDMIPQGWQYPEITCARITFEGRSFITTNFQDTIWKQSADIVFDGNVPGTVDVCYLEERPERDEGPFCRQQRELIDDIARQLGVLIHREKVKRERERLLSAIEQVGEMIIITDPLGTIQYINPAFERMTGYSRKEALGQNLRMLKSDRQDQTSYRNLWDDVANGQTWQGRMVNTRKDGTPFTVEATISPVRDASGSIVNYVAVMHDITEHLKLSAQLQQAQKMESLGTLAGGIAHDFNNILSAIIGFTELAIDKAAGSMDLLGNLKEVYRAGVRASALVQQILTFSRRTDIELKPLEIGIVIREAMRLLRSTLPTSIEIRQRIKKGLDPVLADPTQIHQIIMNLCTNASHAMEPHGGILEVTLDQAAIGQEQNPTIHHLDPGRYLKLTVNDTGCGMTPEITSSIFDPYFTTKDLGEGTGLGLSVVLGIVRDYGGDILVDSTPGKGSNFTIYLPTIESAPAETEKSESELLPRGIERILVVDDEPSLLKMTGSILMRQGYRVTTESDGERALKRFKSDPEGFDLVLSDVTMPKMTGDLLAAEILAIRSDIPVVLCTGYSRILNEQGLKSLGVRALVSKPIARHTLLTEIRRVLNEPIQ